MTATQSTALQSRHVERLVQGKPTSDGAGVRLTRVLTQNLQRRLDPFLMLDAFRNENPEDYIGGFPDHPHRGFEAVTYMLAGRMRHHDNAGNTGLLQPGGAQWMTAGSGLIHSELPEQEEGLMEGFQLWINLSASRKMSPPHYKDVAPEAIPEIDLEHGGKVRIVAGERDGTAGAIHRPDTEPVFLDVHLPAGHRFSHPLPSGLNGFAYVYRGRLDVGGTEVPQSRMAILANDAERFETESVEDARFILVAGKPLREPIAQYGPFVMNTQEEIEQAVRDWRDGFFESNAVGKD